MLALNLVLSLVAAVEVHKLKIIGLVVEFYFAGGAITELGHDKIDDVLSIGFWVVIILAI